MTKKLLDCIGINPFRIRLEWISASEAPKFAQVIKDFVEEVKRIGPNPFIDRGESPWTQTNFRTPDLYT
jgi:coenzyme F420-reducing hydrogenase delta subunit